MTEPKLILFDLETLPNLKEVLKHFPGLSNYPGLTFKASINSIICFGYKVFGENKTECINAWDFKGWRSDVNDDYELVRKAYDVLVDASAVITHNGKRFDWKFLQTRILHHGLRPLPKILHIDTCQESKKHLLMFSNKLDTIGKAFTDQAKMENGGWDLWVRVSNRDPSAMKTMTQYCKQDVNVLDEVFKKLRPLVTTIPNYNKFTDLDRHVCPSCGSTRIQKRGLGCTKERTFQKYQCRDCGSWSQSVKADK